MTCSIPARRKPAPLQFGIGWNELLSHVLQVPVSAPSSSANDYAGFIVEEDIHSLLLKKLPSSLAKPDPSTWRKNRIIHIIWNLFIPYRSIHTIQNYSYHFLAIVQVLNHLVYHHVHFDGVVCLKRTFTSQIFFQAVAKCFHQHSWWLEPSLFHSGFCLAGLSTVVHFDHNKLGKVPS